MVDARRPRRRVHAEPPRPSRREPAADRLPGHDRAAVRGRREVLARRRLLVAARGHRDREARRPRRTATSIPAFPSQRTRRDWGNGPAWTRGAPTYAESRGATPRLSVAVPELPQMQALAERIEEWLRGATFEGYVPLGFSGLKTAVPSPDELIGRTLTRVGRRAKYVMLEFDGEPERRVVFHLSQAGRVDFEQPPKSTKPKGSVVRWKFSDDRAGARARVRHRAQGRLVGARPGRRRPARDARARGDERRVRAVAAHRRRRPARAHDPARPAHGRRRRPRLRRRRAAPGQAVAVRVAEVADAPTNASACSPRSSRCSTTASSASARATGGLSANKLGEHFTVHGKAGLPVPGVRRRPEARVVRVARGRVLPALPDRRQGARRPPPLPPREVATSAPAAPPRTAGAYGERFGAFRLPGRDAHQHEQRHDRERRAQDELERLLARVRARRSSA